MNDVFSEAKIGRVTLKNRILRSATHEGMADEKGRPTIELIKSMKLWLKVK